MFYVGAQGVYLAAFGEGMDRIWLDNVQCAGSEGKLADCPSNAVGIHSCTHAQDAGVRCSPGKTYT